MQKIRFEDDYFNLEKCQARDREYKKYSLQEFNPDVLPANASPVDPEYYQHTVRLRFKIKIKISIIIKASISYRLQLAGHLRMESTGIVVEF